MTAATRPSKRRPVRARQRPPRPPRNPGLADLVFMAALMYAVMLVMSLPLLLIGIPQVSMLCSICLLGSLVALLVVER